MVCPPHRLPALTVFTSGLVLFLVQPVSARLILPWLGGSAAVWTTCMVTNHLTQNIPSIPLPLWTDDYSNLLQVFRLR